MAREEKSKGELEEILVATDIDTEGYRNRLHNQLKVLMDQLDVRAIDHPQWLVKAYKDTESVIA